MNIANVGFAVVRQLIEVPVDVIRQAWRVGPVDFGEKAFKNPDKIGKLASVLFDFANLSQNPAARATKRHTEAIYGLVLPFKMLSDSFVDKENFRFKLPEKNIVSSILLLFGSFANFAHYLSKDLKLFTIPYVAQVAEDLGKTRLFQFHCFGIFLNKAKDGFTFWASFVNIGETIKADYELYQKKCKECQRNKVSTPDPIKIFLSPLSVLKYVNNIGKMTLIYYGSTSYDKKWFLGVAATTNTVSLATVLYK